MNTNKQKRDFSDSLHFNYLGPLVTDSSVIGEQKSDGVIPGHPGGGCVQISENRWIMFFATIDPRGWDSNRSIIYQIRAGKPDGKVLKEKVLVGYEENWNPYPMGDSKRLFKSCGMPIAFGVPKGATLNGQKLINENVFVVKWYRWALKHHEGRLLHPSHHNAVWPEGANVRNMTCRVEWAQFKLNDDENDIEILSCPEIMHQKGYAPVAENFCSHHRVFMNHSMKSPCPYDELCLDWVEFDTFVPYSESGQIEHGCVAPVQIQFNAHLGRYEWIKTGPLINVPDRILGESSVNRIGNDWFIAMRSFSPDSSTCWFRTEDPFSPLGKSVIRTNADSPRTVFLCADGQLRLFGNDESKNGSDYSRNPMSCWDVNLADFSLTNRRVIFDSEGILPFREPMIDMVKLCPNQGNRQLVLYRCITREHTVNSSRRNVSSKENFAAGIYHSEILYDDAVPEPWEFTKVVKGEIPAATKINTRLTSPRSEHQAKTASAKLSKLEAR